MLTLIEGGEVYTPSYVGSQTVLLAGSAVLKVGAVERTALDGLGMPYKAIDAADCLVIPGLLDPHSHLLGAAGESGFASRTPPVSIAEIVGAGVTTVVGCLGTDTTTRHLTALLGQVRQVEAEGVTAYMYTGGFPVPPPTITASVTDDVVIVDKVIGVGEIAISDVRSSSPSQLELARIVSQAVIGGMISGKAGVAHFHVGPARARLSPLHSLLDHYEVPASALYATHITRSRELMDDAIALARRGAYVNIDTAGSAPDEVVQWLRYYVDHDGPLPQLSMSTDAHTAGATYEQFREAFVACARDSGLMLEDVLRIFSFNTATALKLTGKGRVDEGLDADLLVVRKNTLEIVHVIARGRMLVQDGQVVVPTQDDAVQG